MTENNEWICTAVETHSNGVTPEKAPLWAPGVTLGLLWGSGLTCEELTEIWSGWKEGKGETVLVTYQIQRVNTLTIGMWLTCVCVCMGFGASACMYILGWMVCWGCSRGWCLILYPRRFWSCRLVGDEAMVPVCLWDQLCQVWTSEGRSSVKSENIKGCATKIVPERAPAWEHTCWSSEQS